MLLAIVAGHVEIVGQCAGPQAGAGMHVPGERGRRAIAADLGGGRAVGAEAGAQPAICPGDADA
jgi:hypothetical protein